MSDLGDKWNSYGTQPRAMQLLMRASHRKHDRAGAFPPFFWCTFLIFLCEATLDLPVFAMNAGRITELVLELRYHYMNLSAIAGYFKCLGETVATVHGTIPSFNTRMILHAYIWIYLLLQDTSNASAKPWLQYMEPYHPLTQQWFYMHGGRAEKETLPRSDNYKTTAIT